MKMPRTKNIKTIEAEISQTEEQLRRLKERCDKASQKLDALYELKKHREQEELLKAIDLNFPLTKVGLYLENSIV
ncbi:MAG: hypothetical protein ACFWTT_09725 [Lactobacillus delbrueckii]|jgi:septal ring factor EnvC (AmiA/AmiB activator)